MFQDGFSRSGTHLKASSPLIFDSPTFWKAEKGFCYWELHRICNMYSALSDEMERTALIWNVRQTVGLYCNLLSEKFCNSIFALDSASNKQDGILIVFNSDIQGWIPKTNCLAYLAWWIYYRTYIKLKEVQRLFIPLGNFRFLQATRQSTKDKMQPNKKCKFTSYFSTHFAFRKSNF